MKSYLSYKDSEVEWIGEIPNNWKIAKIKFLANYNELKLSENTEPNYKINYIEIGDVKNQKIINKTYDKFKNIPVSGRRILRKNDILISCVRTYLKSITIIEDDVEDLICSTGFCVLSDINKVHHKYLYYIVLTDGFISKVVINSTGVTYPTIKPEKLVSLKVLLPPHPEQQQIVEYLDHKTQKIDELIEKTERKIELLKEKRTSLINHCVTKGLNPNVEMKDIGVEWIGEIPSHWEVKRLKQLCGYNLDSLGDETKSDYELDYIEIGDVDSFGNINNPTHYQYSESPSRCRRKIKKNDIIISTVRTYLKAIGFIEDEVSDLICSTGFCVITPNEEIIPKILFYLVRSEWFVFKVVSLSEGVSYPSIQSEKLVGIKVVLAPKSEQQQIVEYLDTKTQEIDSTIEKETQRIELLKEYSQSLISEVVSGKIDVRDEAVV